MGTETLTRGTTVADANVGVKTVSVGNVSVAMVRMKGELYLCGGTHQLTINQRPLNATLSRQYTGQLRQRFRLQFV